MRALPVVLCLRLSALSVVLAAGSPFSVPPANAGFVPVLKDGSTLWLYLSSLRRMAFPMIAQNQPERSLFIASARRQKRCGITPTLKGLGYEEVGGTCFPSALPWMWSNPAVDRTDYVMKLHSTNVLASIAAVYEEPQHTRHLGSAAPWEVLLARSEPRLRFNPSQYSLGIERDMWVDTAPNFNKARSPEVLRHGTVPLRRRQLAGASAGDAGAPDADGSGRKLFDGWNASDKDLFEYGHKEFNLFGSQFLLTDGLIAPSANSRVAYPTLTALQFIFLSSFHTGLAALVNASCWCDDPALESCPLSYLCFILDRATFTMFLPTDDGFKHLTCGAWDFLISHREVAAAVVSYHVLGQVTFVCPLRGPGQCALPVVARRLQAMARGEGGAPQTRAEAAEAHRLSVSVNARLAHLSRARALLHAETLQPGAPTTAGGVGGGAGGPSAASAPASDAGAPAHGGDPARRRLGFFGSSAGNLPNLPRNVDDFLLWTTVPFFTPFPSWIYHEQLGDLVRNTGVYKAQTFHPLLGANGTGLPLNASQTLNWTAPLFPGAVISDFIPFFAAQVLLSYGPPYPCREPCGACQHCRDDCDECRDWAGLPRVNFGAVGGRRAEAGGSGNSTVAANNVGRGGVCAAACGCSLVCYDCECCRVDNAGAWPASMRRLTELTNQQQGQQGEGGEEGAGGAARSRGASGGEAGTDGAATRGGRQLEGPRQLCDDCYTGGHYAQPLVLTCIDVHCNGAVTDWSCEAATIPPYTDIETLNAVIHFTSNVLLPPDVLLALWRNGTRPYVTSPPMSKVAVPTLSDCPYLPAGHNDTFLGLGLSGIFRLLRNASSTQGHWHGHHW